MAKAKGGDTSYLTAGDVAFSLSRDLGKPITPKMVSTLLYDRKITEFEIPIVCGRRLIPQEAMPRIREEIKQRLARRGKGGAS